MRNAICMAVLTLAAGCGRPEIECARNTCSGCCTSDGECVLGSALTACGGGGGACVDCSAHGLVCNSGGACGAQVDAGQDAGHDAGTQPDAGSPWVFVTFRYDISTVKVTGCPPLYGVETCSAVKEMTKAKLDALRPNYPSCPVTQESVDGWTIDCTGECATQLEYCQKTSGSTASYDLWVCWAWEHAAQDHCSWTP